MFQFVWAAGLLAGVRGAQMMETCGDVKSMFKRNRCCGSPSAPLNVSYTMLQSCDAASVELADFPQWRDEEGYWLGELSLYDASGDPSVSATWNYRYDHYRSFITGNIMGGAYRQRNIFMYPQQHAAACQQNNDTVGEGVCGVNGNMKFFQADQSASMCDPLKPGAIEGPYEQLQYTYTTLIGHDNAVHYLVYLTAESLNYFYGAVLGNPLGNCVQVSAFVFDCGFTEDRLMQSQLTTLSRKADGTHFRVRTAQGFDAFTHLGPTYASYYRETKVSKDEFYQRLNATLVEYAILETDYAQYKSGSTGGTELTGLPPTWPAMYDHLEESFRMSE